MNVYIYIIIILIVIYDIAVVYQLKQVYIHVPAKSPVAAVKPK